MSIGSEGTVSMGVKVDVTEAIRQLTAMQTTMKALGAQFTEFQSVIGRGITSPLGTQIQQIGDSSQQAATKTQTFVERMSGFQGNLLTAATSVGTFTASIFGIDAAMDNLTAAELALETQRLRTDRTATTLEQTELRLKTGRDNGNLSVEQQEILEQRITTLREREAVETEKLDFMQQNLNESHAQFAAQIMPQVIAATLSGVTAITSIIQVIGKSEKATALLNNAWKTLSTTFSATNVTPLTSGLASATVQTSGFHKALSLVPVALGVVGASVAIAGTAIALYTTNAFGARDAMHMVGAAIGDAAPPLEGFLNLLEHSGRLWTNLLTGPPIFAKTLGEMSKSVDTATAAIDTSFQTIEDSMQVIVTNVQAVFQKVGSSYDEFKTIFLDEQPYIRATAGSEMMISGIEELGKALNSGKDISASNLKIWAEDVSAWSTQVANAFKEAGKPVPIMVTEIQRLVNELNTQLKLDPNMDFTEVKAKIEAMLNNVSDVIIKWGPNFKDELNKAIRSATEPIAFNIDEIIQKMADMKLPPSLAIESRSITQNIDAMTTAFNNDLVSASKTDEQLMLIAQRALPMLVAKYNESNGTILTQDQYLQNLVNTTDLSAKSNNGLAVGLGLVADKNGIVKETTAEVTEKLTEEEQKLADLAKSYFDLNLTTSEAILEKKAQIEWVENAIQKYDDEIESLKELQIEYGSNEQAVYGVNQATMDLIESKKNHIIQEQAVTLGLIDVTKALDGSKESQILMNEAMIDGKTAAADFVTELVKGEAQAKAYGKALSDNVLKILKEMPDAIGKLADEFRNTLPKTFESLSQFEGMIKPFDKDSIKEYKDFLKEMDVPKDIKKLAIKAADIWQDKDEIIKETEAIFGAMTGIMANKFESINPETVTSFLDEISNKVTEMEGKGIDANITQPLKTLIDHIKNSSDPVKEMFMHWEELNGAMDPKAFNDVTLATKMFGDEMVVLVQSATLGDFVLFNENLATAFERIAGSGAPEAISAYVKAAEQWNASVGKQMKEGGTGGFMLLNEAQAEANKQGYGPKGAEKAGGPEETAKAWEDAKLRIETATAAISTAVTNATTLMGAGISSMQAVMVTSLGIVDAKVVGTQGVFSLFSTSVGTYATSMQTNVSTMAAVEVASLDLVDTNVTESQGIWSTFSTSVATYSKSMQTNFDTFAKATIGNLDLIDENILETQKAASTLSTSWATYCKSMATNADTWQQAMVKAFDAVAEGAGKAEDAVKGLADAIAALKDKTVTIKVDVQESSTSSQQYGGVKLLTHPQYVFGGEGHKPEIHMSFPLDEMSQSHSKSAFKLPFNLKDLQVPNIAAPTIGLGNGGAGAGGYPSQLNSNIRANLNLNIDLGQQVRQIVREEINLRATTRLDRMGFK